MSQVKNMLIGIADEAAEVTLDNCPSRGLPFSSRSAMLLNWKQKFRTLLGMHIRASSLNRILLGSMTPFSKENSMCSGMISGNGIMRI